MPTGAWRRTALLLSSVCWLATCGGESPASLATSVVVVSTSGDCSTEAGKTVCRTTKALTVTVRETTGRDVALQSLSGILFDTRGMQDMHAQPAELSAEDIRVAVGSSSVPGGAELNVPYTLAFEVVQPAIVGPIKAIVRVRGRDSDGNVVEASAEAR
jgi:hypothetical protein